MVQLKFSALGLADMTAERMKCFLHKMCAFVSGLFERGTDYDDSLAAGEIVITGFRAKGIEAVMDVYGGYWTAIRFEWRGWIVSLGQDTCATNKSTGEIVFVEVLG